MSLFVFATLNLKAQLLLQKTKFTQIEVSAGLSNSNVACILQDKKGFLWVGIEDGLNKYDGYEFTVYRHQPLDSLSLVENSINSLFELIKMNVSVKEASTMLGISAESVKKSRYRLRKKTYTGREEFP